MSKQSHKSTAVTALLSAIEKNLDLERKNPVDASAWFLGPKAENEKALLDLVAMATKSQITARKQYMPTDPPIFSGESDDHDHSIEIIKQELDRLLTELKGSIPLASYRNQSHMYWDLTLPGVVGYFAAMLYNQNNVAAEASPVTTLLEIQVGKDLCEMLGFRPLETSIDAPVEPWGHITCDGSIANGESMWAARNLKFLPVALAAAIATEAELDAAKRVTVKTCKGDRHRLIDLNIWELLNLPIDEVIGLVATIQTVSGIDESIIRHAVDHHSVQNIGLVKFQQYFLDTYAQATPVIFVPATAHYSWPKTAALTGLGTESVKPIKVDLDGRMSILELRRELDRCLHNGHPVLQVVAVLGSTEEGAIDPLADIVRLRKEYQEMGLNFLIHVDAAWGGYFTSILRTSGLGHDPAKIIDEYPELYVSDYFKTQFAALPYADSVTLDPHKSGFIPYPAGSLCYRNGAMRDSIAFTAPVVFHAGVDVTVGPYGIEGSKPGAAAASVYLSHKVIPLNNIGYGKILGRCLFNSKRFYAALVSMDLPQTRDSQKATMRFNITPFQRLPIEKQGGSYDQVIKQKLYLKENIVPYSTEELIELVFGLKQDKKTEQQTKALETFQAIGSDLGILTYAFNFKTGAGLNTDLILMNELNNKIFRALSLKPSGTENEVPTVEMFITSSEFDPATYGQILVDDFARRAGVDPLADTPITFLISTTQNPWLSTHGEDKNINMIDLLIAVLTKTVNQATDEIINDYNLDKCYLEN